MSTDPLWFSACLRFVVLVEGAEADGHYADSVIVFRASEWDEAHARAVSIGRARETTYRNTDGATAVWRLKEVRTLDQLGSDLDDGRELFWRTEPFAPAETFGIDTTFTPDRPRPTQTGV